MAIVEITTQLQMHPTQLAQSIKPQLAYQQVKHMMEQLL